MLVIATRSRTNTRWPTSTSGTPSGVASIARYCRRHLMAASTANVDSLTAVCIACAARIPGATKARYSTPGIPPRVPLSTSGPSR